jgi:hypothetical protein
VGGTGDSGAARFVARRPANESTCLAVPPSRDSPLEFHEVSLACEGTSCTIRIDDQLVFGPVSSTLRPSAVYLGNPALAYWYPTDWQWFTVDYFRVETPGSPVGACCFPAGVRLQGDQVNSQLAGGYYLGDGTSCEPDPCLPTAVEPSTWGHLESRYRG